MSVSAFIVDIIKNLPAGTSVCCTLGKSLEKYMKKGGGSVRSIHLSPISCPPRGTSTAHCPRLPVQGGGPSGVLELGDLEQPVGAHPVLPPAEMLAKQVDKIQASKGSLGSP